MICRFPALEVNGVVFLVLTKRKEDPGDEIVYSAVQMYRKKIEMVF